MATPLRLEPAAGGERASADLAEEDVRVLAGRRAGRLALERALAGVPGTDPGRALQRLAATMPVALSVETVGIRIRDSEEGLLHLVAHEGAPTRDRRRLVLEPLSLGRAKSIMALASHHSFARDLGLRWLDGEWIRIAGEPAGTIVVGCRTERRPDEEERTLLRRVAVRLGTRLLAVDRRARTLRALTLRLARETVVQQPGVGGSVLAGLRPRERTILDLYTDGMSAQDIADLLVISPHTVRTHVKHAFRRLGVHSREEAADLIQDDRLLRLI